MSTHIINERDRTCMKCEHKWTAPVEFSPYTRNLTGEVTPHCPICADNAIMSGPNKAYVHMEQVIANVNNGLRAIGYSHEVKYEQWANGWADGPHWEIKPAPKFYFTGGGKTMSVPDLPTFYLHQEERIVSVQTLMGKTAEKRWVWVVDVIITKTPSNRDEPPYEDNFEVCTHATAEGALIEAILCYFRNRMYDSISVVEPEVEEAWP